MTKKKKRTEYEYYSAEEEVYYREGPGLWAIPSNIVKGVFNGAAWMTRGVWHWTWMLTRGSFRWSWNAVKWSWRFSGSVINWSLGLTGSILISLWYFIVGAPVHDLPEYDEFGNPNVKAIRAHMKRRYGRRYRFAAHGVVYLFSMAAMWLDYMLKVQYFNNYQPLYWDYPRDDGQIFVTVLWTLFLILHVIRFNMTNSEEKAVEQELERRLGRKPYDPAYYERQMRLSDDGELVYVDDYSDEKRKLQSVE